MLAPGGQRPGRECDAKPARHEPNFYDTFSHETASTHDLSRTPADAFDQYLAAIEQTHHAESAPYEDPAAFESDDRDYSNAATLRPHKRGRLVQVGAGLGVLVLCVTGALAWRGFHGGGSNGQPVTVLADRTPLKVAPEKADGVDIPDQNKQIYDRTAKDGQIKVVNREEQPLDVVQAARSAASRDANASAGVTPGSGGTLTESLGEPRKIRTVAVKPDTPPPTMQQQREAAAPEVGPAPASPIPTMMMPDGDSTATPAAAPRKSSRTLASTTVPAKPAPVQTADASAAIPTAMQAAAPAPRKTIQRVASVSPEITSSTSEPAAPAATVSAAAVGGFSVQLGVRNSETDARAAFRQMQGKYSQLAGKPELIRQAEVNGQSLYRVRVGPLAKNEATSLCTSLKDAGGQCFVAKN